MNKKYLLKTNFWFLGKGYKAGTEITLSPEEIRDYRIKNLVGKDLIVKIEDQTTPESDIEEDVEAKPVEIDIDVLKSVKGIGDAFARDIMNAYEYEHELLKDSPEEIADKVGGVSVRLAKMIKSRVEMD